MCLERLADFKVPDPGVGWKVFFADKDEPHISGFFTCEYSVFYEWLPENWYRIDNIETLLAYGRDEISIQQYLIGFHVFLNKDDAEGFWESYENTFILPVRFRYIVATGYQDDKKVVVAKEMMILAEEDL